MVIVENSGIVFKVPHNIQDFCEELDIQVCKYKRFTPSNYIFQIFGLIQIAWQN